MQEDTELTPEEGGSLTELARAAQETGTTADTPEGTLQDGQPRTPGELVRQGFWLGMGIWIACAVCSAALVVAVAGARYVTSWVCGDEVRIDKPAVMSPGSSSHR